MIEVAEEAFSAALAAIDAYQTVGSAAWPIRALIERGQETQAAHWLPKLVELSDAIANPVSKLNALLLLWQAAFPAIGTEKNHILDKLVAACHSADSWQAGRAMRDIILVIAQDRPLQADKLFIAMQDGAYKRQTQYRLADGAPGHIRSFFWNDD